MADDDNQSIEFVLEVEKYPCLYNNTLPSYSRRTETDKAWAEIGKTMKMTEVLFIKSDRGRTALQIGNYRYNLQRSGKPESPKLFWRCVKRNAGCRASVFTLLNEIVSMKNHHNHF
ncbi:FLYWCH zinc finger domain-containing protein [Phthorimaea operculella]|nr:FLYWCH zinc finger domain-containing protein [Phthorimaea operculella]